MGWPRPPDDNGIGIHFGSVTPRNFEEYLPLLKDLCVKWLVLADDSPDLIGRVATRCLEEGIMPIVRPQTPIDANANFANKARWCKSPYVQIYNEPEDSREWDYGRPRSWWGIFREKWVTQAHRVRSEGCKPGLQITNPDDLELMLDYMVDMGDEDLWPDMWLALHLYPHLGCPPTCIEHEDDILGFLKYAEVCEEIMGFVPPMIITETAWTPSQGTPEERAKWTVKVFEWFQDGLYFYKDPDPSLRANVIRFVCLPDYLFAVCPWILFGGFWHGFRWMLNPDQANPLHAKTVEAVRGMEPFVRRVGGEPIEDDYVGKWRVVSEEMMEYEAQDLLHWLEEHTTGLWYLEERNEND